MFRRVSTQLRPFAAANMATLCPKSSKFPKTHKGRVGGIAHQGTHIAFGKYGLQALEPAWITAKQIESGRRAMVRSARRMWVRVFPDKPITEKPNETRMGRGKGNQAYWVAVVKPGKILYEMDAVSETVAKKAIAIAAAKMPIRTNFIATSVGFRRHYSTMGANYLNEQGREYSTSVPSDSDTHDDFKPTSKLDSSGLSLKDLVEQDVKDHPVMIYMKGVPELIRCGFSSLAAKVLSGYSVPVGATELRSRRNRTFYGPSPLYAPPLYPKGKIRFAPLGARCSRGSREGKSSHHLLQPIRDYRERASSIDERRIDGKKITLGIGLFFSLFLLASSDPFVRNFFVCTESLAELNPVLQDPILAIHPPCIYAGAVASAMGFGLCISKMMNGIVALHSPPMRKDAAEKNGTLFCSAACVGTSEGAGTRASRSRAVSRLARKNACGTRIR